MDYKDIPKYLKRYSFNSKMNACQKYSMQIITLLGIVPPEKMNDQILPWELETFLLFAINAKEYQNTDILEKNERRFFEVINAIRDHDETDRLKSSGTGDFLVELMMHYGLIQFELQEKQQYKYYRYSYFFNFVDQEKGVNIREEFLKKFGVEYNLIMQLGVALSLFLSTKKATMEMIIYIINYFYKAVIPLTITREGYRELLKVCANSIEDYEFCVRPSYSYPFILDDEAGIHFPLPHLLYRATTSALLYRLKENNSKIRDEIGHVVVESYLYEILKTTNIYDEVIPERTYTNKKIECSTPDISIREGDSFLFIESKSSVPPMGIRLFDYEIQKKQIEIIASAIYQLYKQIKLFTEGMFSIFDNMPLFDEHNEKVWGIVSLLEDSFISRKLLYEEFSKLAKIEVDSQEYMWAIHHIKVVSLYDVEKYTFQGTSMINVLAIKATEHQPFDLTLVETAGKEIKNSNLRSFLKQMGKDVEDLTTQMQKKGVIN